MQIPSLHGYVLQHAAEQRHSVVSPDCVKARELCMTWSLEIKLNIMSLPIRLGPHCKMYFRVIICHSDDMVMSLVEMMVTCCR